MDHQYLQDPVQSQNTFNKEDNTSLKKWKSTNESLDESLNNPSSGFDCNICLDSVNDPVVTLCGHLYCWPCIYKWIHHQKTTQNQIQCPVCKTEISQKTIVPLYGRGQTTEQKSQDLDITVPRRPPSPRSNLQIVPAQQPHNPRNFQQSSPMALAMNNNNNFGGGMSMTNLINPTSPTTGMLGEIVYERIFGNSTNSYPSLFAYPNSYNLAGISTQRARRQAMQADRSLNRICFFLLCCVMLCLLLF